VSLETEQGQQTAWWVQTAGKAYGPYSAKQMAAYVAEGRVRPNSMVANAAEGPWSEARTHDALMHNHAATRTLQTAEPSAAVPLTANVFVRAEINSSSDAFLAALEGMGLLVDLAPGTWLLRTRHSVGVIRNTLSQTLQVGDRFVVVDASRDRLAWYNLGPETDVRIKDVWNGPAPAAAR
jgi:hypothetical protein